VVAVVAGITKMIAYTITAPLVDGTSYERTESGSNSYSRNSANYVEGYQSNGGFVPVIVFPRFAYGNENGEGTTNINANGQEIVNRSNSGSNIEADKWKSPGVLGTESKSGSESFSGITSPEGFFTNQYQNQNGFSGLYYDGWPDLYPLESYTFGGNQSVTGHIMAYLTSAPVGGGAKVGDHFFNTIALQTTTKTAVTNYGKITTTTQEKLAKVGTTITQSVGTSVVTLPTTSNAKSWTENTNTNTTATEEATVVTTSMGIDSYWKKTAHTIYILGKGETTAFLKSNVAINATNGGPTDTKAYDTYSGPTTFTITRVAGTTSQKPVVADTADTSPIRPGTIIKNRTYRSIVAENLTATYYTSWGPPFQFNLPLLSTTRIIQTGVSESSSTRAFNELDGSISFGTGAKTTTRSAWGETSVTYNLAGVSYTEGVPTYTQEIYAQPIVRSGSDNATTTFGGSDDTESPWWADNGDVFTISGSEGNTGAFGEQANYFVNFQNDGRQNNGGGADAFYGIAYAWGTLGGTTAEPYQSISVSGIDSSESVTWPFVSISAGVQTPKPFVTVSQKPETSETSSTAAAKTEATTRRIWGNEFGKSTSSQNSSTGTSGSTTTPIQAGGAAITSFQLGGARGFPVNQLAGGWIPAPAMFVIGGIAQTKDSTAIISPGEYANSTITAPQSFSGSSIANTYFEPKAAVTYLCYPS
jgi:hypothetical protein